MLQRLTWPDRRPETLKLSSNCYSPNPPWHPSNVGRQASNPWEKVLVSIDICPRLILFMAFWLLCFMPPGITALTNSSSKRNDDVEYRELWFPQLLLLCRILQLSSLQKLEVSSITPSNLNHNKNYVRTIIKDVSSSLYNRTWLVWGISGAYMNAGCKAEEMFSPRLRLENGMGMGSPRPNQGHHCYNRRNVALLILSSSLILRSPMYKYYTYRLTVGRWPRNFTHHQPRETPAG